MTNNLRSVWHEGELTVQKLMGTDKLMADIGPKFIREFMPLQHREFFESLTMILIGFNDHHSDIHASVLFGCAGFIQSTSKNELVINTQNSMGDFIRDELVIGSRIGLLGIQFDTKRRNRVNGTIIDISQKYIKVKVLQSYGNCPKYIQPKIVLNHPKYANFSTLTRKQLTQRDHDLITHSDTLFIASSFNDGKSLNNRGADISHRGGEAGFVSINPNGQLLMDDYVGNGFFNTLGNLHQNPVASLLFFNWKKGHILKIQAATEIYGNDKQPSPIKLAIGENKDKKKTGITLCFTVKEIEYFYNGLAYKTK